jgi:hypothetical protein
LKWWVAFTNGGGGRFILVVPHPCFNQPGAHRRVAVDMNGNVKYSDGDIAVNSYVSVSGVSSTPEEACLAGYTSGMAPGLVSFIFFFFAE